VSRRRVALTIAGSDSGGGAGILADAAAFRAAGVWPTVAVTAVTAQNTTGFRRVDVLSPEAVRAQIEAVVADIRVDAAKTGMLGLAAVVATVADLLGVLGVPVVVDPVLRSTSGAALVDDAAIDAYRMRLLPVATLVTPNLDEAAALTGVAVVDRGSMEVAGRALVELGAGAALVTGGHLPGDVAADCLVTADGVRWFEAPRIATPHTHGTGCVLSAAITAGLALGDDLPAAVARGRAAVRAAIAAGFALGAGPGPVDPGPVDPGPVDPGPVDPGPVHRSP